MPERELRSSVNPKPFAVRTAVANRVGHSPDRLGQLGLGYAGRP